MQKNLPWLRMGTITLLTLFFIISLASCSRKVSFAPSPAVPAASGWAKVKSTENNYEIEIRIDNLAPAQNLSPPQRVYMVWADTESNGIRRLGSMQSSSGFLSKALKSSLDATLPYKPVMIVITAESEADPQYPGMFTVLRSEPIKVR